jgi:NAD-dependent SIR2 family protein deacetylase
MAELGDAEVENAARFICEHGPISIFTGAGISVGSGIPDFRSPGGLWSRHVPVPGCQVDKYHSNFDYVAGHVPR